MTQKKQHSTSEEAGTGPVEGLEAAAEMIDALKKELETAQARAAENLEGWQRSQAEFVNYRNRVQRDQDYLRVSMKGDILRKVLPVLDDLERALANRPAGDPWADGLELIVRKFVSVLESEGLTRIEAEGLPFDPNIHEAVSHEPSADVESGHVIAVVQNGYVLGERVVRPAVVRVAK